MYRRIVILPCWKRETEDAITYQNGTLTISARPSSSGGDSDRGSSTPANATTTTTNPDGSTTKTTTNADGSTATVKTDKSGNVVSTEVNPSAKAIENAEKSGEPVTLPVEAKAGNDSKSAAEVKVTLPKGETGVTVEIPVENLTPGTVAVIVKPDGTEEIVKTSTTSRDGVVLTLDGSATVKIVDNTKAFSDVQAGDWFADAVTWLVENGIAQGTGASFGADDPISREQLAVMLYNYAKFKGYDVSARGNVNGFPDAGVVDGYAQEALAWAVGVGLISGSTDGSGNVVLDPQGSATRGQIVAIIERFCENVVK